MGKGDLKTKKGKIRAGSYGVSRKRKSTTAIIVPAKPKKAAAKKVTAKKTTAKKAAPKKATAEK